MSGIEKLRKLVNVVGCSRESALDTIEDIHATIRLLEACVALDLETLPDMLFPAECN